MKNRLLITVGASLLCGGVLLAVDTQPAAKLPLAPATTQAATQSAPSINQPAPILPKLRPEPRPFSKRALREAALGTTERPTIVSAGILPPPQAPQMVEGSRRTVTPAPTVTLKLPNLLQTSPKRAMLAPGGNPVINPAAPINTPPVNNVQGTTALTPLAPFTREITIEVSPPPTPLSIDVEPYLQAPDAPDNRDVPAAMPELPTTPHLD